jgi:hypothetical protein
MDVSRSSSESTYEMQKSEDGLLSDYEHPSIAMRWPAKWRSRPYAIFTLGLISGLILIGVPWFYAQLGLKYHQSTQLADEINDIVPHCKQPSRLSRIATRHTDIPQFQYNRWFLIPTRWQQLIMLLRRPIMPRMKTGCPICLVSSGVRSV